MGQMGHERHTDVTFYVRSGGKTHLLSDGMISELLPGRGCALVEPKWDGCLPAPPGGAGATCPQAAGRLACFPGQQVLSGTSRLLQIDRALAFVKYFAGPE